ncbi:MAG TPA: energy-coupling factor transporter transmembrane protein EcfT [Clostridia bacterium]|nr:energy-coupling factor transporter transmembrane protein EcfT [Clostridia bacterium]
MSVVQYVEGNSLLHRLDPRAKIIMLTILTIIIFIVENFLMIGAILLTILLLWWSARLPMKTLASYFKFLTGLFVFIIVIQGLFYSGEVILVQPLIPRWVPLIGGLGKISLDGALFGILISARIICLICLLPLVTMTTPIHFFALGLTKMGLSYQIAYTMTTALNTIPVLQNEASVVMDAQKLRAFRVFEEGSFVQKLKAYPALAVPLVIGAMRRAQLMGVAMDSRAFGALKRRTYVEDIIMKPQDYAVLAVFAVYCAAVLVGNFML